jgi:hypothetical protein
MAVSACMCPVLFFLIPVLNSFHQFIPFFFFFWSNASLYPHKAHLVFLSPSSLPFSPPSHPSHTSNLSFIGFYKVITFFCSFIAISFIYSPSSFTYSSSTSSSSFFFLYLSSSFFSSSSLFFLYLSSSVFSSSPSISYSRI